MLSGTLSPHLVTQVARVVADGEADGAAASPTAPADDTAADAPAEGSCIEHQSPPNPARRKIVFARKNRVQIPPPAPL